MNRRNFLKTTLMALVAAWSPISLPRPRLKAGTNTVTTLNGIFKKVYGHRLRDAIPRQIRIIEDNQKKLLEPVWFRAN